MTTASNTLALVGRILLAAMFVVSGYGKIGPGFAGTVGYINSVGLPLPQALAVAAIILELVAGIALIVGFKTRWAALALALFCLATAFLFHNYWAMPAAQQAMQQILFMKDLAIAGGLLLLAVAGPGAWSLDRGR
jgi:putative oxidoreductase